MVGMEFLLLFNFLFLLMLIEIFTMNIYYLCYLENGSNK